VIRRKKLKAKEEFAHYLASLAQRAILYEVSTTPKPGLVDRENNGAHRDMDFFTFMASSSALYRGLYECALEGLNFEEADSTKLLDRIRIPGINCERAMFETTNGINTHKGIIFSMGILCAVTGKLHRRDGNKNFNIEDICDEVKEISRDLTLKDFKDVLNKEVLTYGERLYKEYGFKGIRGEVESGFNTVRKNAVNLMREWAIKKQFSMNDLFLEVILNLMAESEDTNVITRGGLESLEYVKSTSRKFLQSGGMKQPNAVEILEELNQDFIKRNISPGGSADLLAVGIFLGMMEGIIR
jgi:triphosphoribosyl-dephospho-CoA synthase